ncbi:IclR family transcriptional regulator [Salipiger sp. PrR002]|uniref:IclR family transcriptional regulator n=1 Tax=Salipiger sp. PrR002 TaxID=2706489 RepID=UPI0013B6FA73|nr:helix-turn-helix domain-containing protein [Salipiger sp. PrR002]NDW01892.1 helix-turn-helix domain-containing protein [Salipiger sp. PrR002]NDW59078.1 helix-turn-helix domain-containing protein [Salipiger sp. PrR004]
MDKTLIKGLALLEHVVMADGPVSISELSREVGLTKSNVHRTLTSLQSAGYLLFDPTLRRYYPSWKLPQLGAVARANFPFRRAILPFVEALSAELGESAHFALPSGDDVVFIANAAPRAGAAAVMPDNHRLRASDTAFGLVLTGAELPENAERHGALVVLRDHPARRTFEIAAPVVGVQGQIIGAFGISGPSTRYDVTRHDQQQRILAVRDEVTRNIAGVVLPDGLGGDAA